MDNLLNTTVKVFEEGISVIEDAKISINNLSEAVVVISDKMEELSLTNDFNKEKISNIIAELNETTKSQKAVLELAENKSEELRDEEKEKADKISSIIESFAGYAENINTRLKEVLENFNFENGNLDFQEINTLSEEIGKKVRLFNSEITKIQTINDEVENIKNSISIINESDIASKISNISEMISDVNDKAFKLTESVAESDLKIKENNILKNIELIKSHFLDVADEIEKVYEKTRSLDVNYTSLNEELSNIIHNKCGAIYEALDKIHADNLSNSTIIENAVNEIKSENEVLNNNIQKNITELNDGFNNSIKDFGSNLDCRFEDIKNYNKSLNDDIDINIKKEVGILKAELEQLRNENKEVNEKLSAVIINNEIQQSESFSELKKMNISLLDELKKSQEMNRALLEQVNNSNNIETTKQLISFIGEKFNNFEKEIVKIKLQNIAMSRNVETNNKQLMGNLDNEVKKITSKIGEISEGIVKSQGLLQTSIKNMTKNINVDNDSYLVRGDRAFQNGMYEEAYKYYKAGSVKKDKACIHKLKEFEKMILNKSESGNAEFMYVKGLMEEDKRNYEEALKIYEQSARSGYEKAKKSYLDLCLFLARVKPEYLEFIGDAYYYGKILNEDKEKAKEYYMKASSAGCTTASEKLKLYYIALKYLKV